MRLMVEADVSGKATPVMCPRGASQTPDTRPYFLRRVELTRSTGCAYEHAITDTNRAKNVVGDADAILGRLDLGDTTVAPERLTT